MLSVADIVKQKWCLAILSVFLSDIAHERHAMDFATHRFTLHLERCVGVRSWAEAGAGQRAPN